VYRKSRSIIITANGQLQLKLFVVWYSKDDSGLAGFLYRFLLTVPNVTAVKGRCTKIVIHMLSVIKLDKLLDPAVENYASKSIFGLVLL